MGVSRDPTILLTLTCIYSNGSAHAPKIFDKQPLIFSFLRDLYKVTALWLARSGKHFSTLGCRPRSVLAPGNRAMLTVEPWLLIGIGNPWKCAYHIKKRNIQDKMTSSMSPNDMVKLNNDEITIVSNSLAPQRSRTITMRSNSDWFTPQTRLQKQIKRQKERLWRKTKSTKERIDYIYTKGNMWTNLFVMQKSIIIRPGANKTAYSCLQHISAHQK